MSKENLTEPQLDRKFIVKFMADRGGSATFNEIHTSLCKELNIRFVNNELMTYTLMQLQHLCENDEVVKIENDTYKLADLITK